MFAPSAALADEPADTIVPSIELDEVVVEGVNQRAKAGELSFIPTKRQKEVAQGGYDLLRHLAMPQISVDPIKGNVTTLTGDDVAIYINGIPASENEIKALKTSDVLKVQYLESPIDPRYDGKKHVIDFTVKQQEQGGYTRASVEYFTTAFEMNNLYANLYTKFAYKRMVYDLYVGNGLSKDYDYADIAEQFSLLSLQGEPYILQKTQTTTQSSKSVWALPVAFRAIYSNDKIQISNTFQLYLDKLFDNSYQGIMQLSTAPGIDYDYRNSDNQIYRDYSWQGFYTFNLGKGIRLAIMPNIVHRHINSHKLYETNVPNQTGILTDSRENMWSGHINASVVKEFAELHSVSLNYRTGTSMRKTEYFGSSVGLNDIDNMNMGATVGYNAAFPFNLRLNAEVGFAREKSVVNEIKEIKITPTASVDASYVPNDRHQINLSLSYSSNPPADAYKTATVVQSDEWMYMTGNPGLKPYNSFRSQLYYTWLPSNKFYATAVFKNYTEFNSITQVYSHYNSGEALLRSYISDGNYYSWLMGLKFTYKPVSKLKLELSAAYTPATRTGINKLSVHPIEGSLSATYYMGKFYVNVFAYLAGDKILPLEGAVMNNLSSYGITAGWGNKHWNVYMYAQNIFKDSWETGSYRVVQPLYTKNQTNYSYTDRRAFGVIVSYTFDYGQKVQHGNEVTQPTPGSSSILK